MPRPGQIESSGDVSKDSRDPLPFGCRTVHPRRVASDERLLRWSKMVQDGGRGEVIARSGWPGGARGTTVRKKVRCITKGMQSPTVCMYCARHGVSELPQLCALSSG